MPLPVIVIGAGVSGLALAQGLSKCGISFELFESDPSLTARTQGYRVRISDEGIESLKQSLSTAHFQRLDSCCGLKTGSSNVPQAILNAETGETGSPLFKSNTNTPDPVQSRYKPLSADRGVLRKILLEGIEDRVSFGWRFQSYVESNEAVFARFENGIEVEGSVLVGADGVWSRVRQQLLPSYALLDSGARLVFGKTHITESFTRQFSRTASKGLTYVKEDGLSCLLEPMHFSKDIKDLPASYVYWVLFLRSDADTTPENIMLLGPEETTTLAQQLTSNWHPSLHSLFNFADPRGTSVLRILSASPSIPDWAGDAAGAERITLIGDSAHAMAPTSALGATTALQDASALETALQLHGSVPRALREYETLMRKYASEALQKSLIGGRNVFGMRPFEELPEVRARP